MIFHDQSSAEGKIHDAGRLHNAALFCARLAVPALPGHERDSDRFAFLPSNYRIMTRPGNSEEMIKERGG